MPSGNDEGYSIRLGTWTDHSKGPVYGPTLTVSSRDGVLLIAFLALLVTWSGNQLWAAFSYYIHQRRSTPEPRDALHHQTQILLRVGYNNIGFLWRLLQITWAWRGIPGSTSRNMPLLTLAVVHMVLVVVASIFTSRIAISNGPVLMLPNNCGWPPLTFLDLAKLNTANLAPDDATFYGAHWVSHRAQNYATMCYNGGPTDSASMDCNSFVQRALSKTEVNYTDTCPFQDEICDTAAITYNSGLLDSDVDLGINAKPRDRIQFRRVVSCASIPADSPRFSTDWNTTLTPELFRYDPQTGPGLAFKYYDFGPSIPFGIRRPYTYWISNATRNLAPSYYVFASGAFVNDTEHSTFEPRWELARDDADVTLWSLRNAGIFTSVISDPWFRATTPEPIGAISLYTSDFDISVLGCTEQYQFCNGADRCTAPAGLSVLTPDTMTSRLGMNPMQVATFNVLWRIAYTARIFNQLFLLQDDVLQAKDRSYGPMDFSTSLPPNQWQIEVGALFNASLAMLQDLVPLHSSPADLQISQSMTYDDFVIKESTPADVQVCAATKIRSQAFYSFSSAGLACVTLLAAMGMLLGNFAPQIASATRRRRTLWRERLVGLNPRLRSGLAGRPLKTAQSWSPDDDDSATTAAPTLSSRFFSFFRRGQRSSFDSPESLPSIPPPYAAREWAATDILPLLRTALENNGVTGWTATDIGASFPVRVSGVDPEQFTLPWMPPEEKQQRSASSSSLSATKRRQEQHRKKLEAHERRRQQRQQQQQTHNRRAPNTARRRQLDDYLESNGLDGDDIVIYHEKSESTREKDRTFYVEDLTQGSRSASASTLASNGGDSLVVSPISPPAAAAVWPPTFGEFKKVSVTNKTFPQRIDEGELRRIESSRGIKGMIG